MGGGAQQTPTQVASRDGTEVGYFTSGDGPPLVLVHGALGDHTGGPRCCRTWRPTSPSTPVPRRLGMHTGVRTPPRADRCSRISPSPE
jgi:hypothetical protein